jgi:COP9 signalosome complex subunit 4
MIESNRLSGNIDQISSLVHFFPTEQSGVHSTVDLSTRDLRAWDANIAHLSEEVEKVTTLLQREEPTFYEGVMAA